MGMCQGTSYRGVIYFIKFDINYREYSQNRHCEKAFSADSSSRFLGKAIFPASLLFILRTP